MGGRGWVLGASLALVLAAGGTWVGVSAHAVGGVVVEAGWPTCDGTSIELHRDESGTGPSFTTPAVELTEGMRCTLTYRVENPAGMDLRVSKLVLPVGGPRGGAGFKVVDIDGTPAQDLPDDIDAIWTSGVDLPADGFVDLRVEVRFRADGCTDAGWLGVAPTVSVSYLGRTRDVRGPESPLFSGTRASTCRGTAEGVSR